MLLNLELAEESTGAGALVRGRSLPGRPCTDPAAERRHPGGSAWRQLVRASSSDRRNCRRVLSPRLVNTLRRCHSTVRGLRYSCAAISGLVSPSAASRAIWASWG